jgi:hypothetical protein
MYYVVNVDHNSMTVHLNSKWLKGLRSVIRGLIQKKTSLTQ